MPTGLHMAPDYYFDKHFAIGSVFCTDQREKDGSVFEPEPEFSSQNIPARLQCC